MGLIWWSKGVHSLSKSMQPIYLQYLRTRPSKNVSKTINKTTLTPYLIGFIDLLQLTEMIAKCLNANPCKEIEIAERLTG